MNANSNRTTEQIIAILVMGWGVGWFGCYWVSDGWQPAVIAGGLGVTSIAVASSIWRSSARAAVAYVCWAVVDVLGLVTVDVIRDEDLWKVALGGACGAAILAVIGWILISSRRSR